jgi:putative membrane-bound dehydrogenase-like protein
MATIRHAIQISLFLWLSAVSWPLTPLAADESPTPQNTEKAKTAPMPPDKVCESAKLPPGFKLSVFAAEPDVQNPIAITTDERGRLWVAENYSWAGAGAGGFDARQRDRIVILEDTDGDGKHDKRTVFWDKAQKLTSVEVGFGGVWAICLPQLLFIPDEDRDDTPDGPPQVVLDGLDEGVVGHTPANGLKWGPDGWLYARHGIQATSNIGKPGWSTSQRVRINTGVWRYHPTRGTVEAVLHGMTNSWGFDFDQYGEMFVINTVIGHLWHVVPGAHVKRMYGIDMNAHAYRLIDQAADHVHWDTGEAWGDVRKGVTDKTSAAGGGHAHIGLMIYQGDNWPETYRHRVYTLNLHGLRINSDILLRDGAGYTAKHGPDLCHLTDPWFRGMELITGPDGGVFIADWSDTGECHDHDGVHRTSGRIFKLTFGNPKKHKPIDLASLRGSELAQLQLLENCWWPRQARRILAERAATKAKWSDRAEVRSSLLRMFNDEVSVPRRLRIIETLFAIEETSDKWLIEKLAAPNEHERATALRFLVDKLSLAGGPPSPEVRQALVHSARTDSSGLVQLYLASGMQRLPLELRWPIAEQLAAKKEFANDRMLPLMLWYGIEPAIPRDAPRALLLARNSQIPILTECVARRLTLEIERDLATVERLLEMAIKEEATRSESIIAGMALALQGWQSAPVPAGWRQAAEQLSKHKSADIRRHVQGLGVVFGDGRTLDELQRITANGGADSEARRQSLRALLVRHPSNYSRALFKFLGDRAIAIEAIRGLAMYDDADTPRQILSHLGNYSPAERAEVMNTLVSRPSYARSLLEALRDKKIAANEISAFHARQIRSFQDESLTKQLTELWGDVRESTADKRALIDRYKVELTPVALSKANLKSGRELFQKSCSNCHVLYGVGRALGPDLTGSNRRNIDYLLENVVDPSASVGTEFREVLVRLQTGQVMSGVISQQNERTLTLQTAQEQVTLDRKEIEELKRTTNSLMPDALLQNFSSEQVRDLMGYLMSTEQVALSN